MKFDSKIQLKEQLIDLLDNGPPFFPKDTLSDRPMRFFVAESVREKIFETYEKEVARLKHDIAQFSS